MPSENYLHNEVKEIMVTKPSWMLRHGNMIMIGVLSLLLLFSAFFTYPETISTGLTLATPHQSEIIRAAEGNQGLDTILVQDGAQVLPGTPLLVWHDGQQSDYSTILALEALLLQYEALAKANRFTTAFAAIDAANLGSLAPAYAQVLQQMSNPPLLTASVARALREIEEWKGRYLVKAKIQGVARINYILPHTSVALEANFPVVYLEPANFQYWGIGSVAGENFSKVKPGQQVIVQLHELGQHSMSGEVVKVAPLAEKQQHQVVIKLHPGQTSGINPSFTGTASIILENKSLLSKIVAY